MLALRRLLPTKHIHLLFHSIVTFSTKMYFSIFNWVLVLFCFGFVLFNEWVERIGTEEAMFPHYGIYEIMSLITTMSHDVKYFILKLFCILVL